MDTGTWPGWWPALALLVVVLALVAALVDGRGRLGSWRRPRARGERAPQGTTEVVPRSGEIWWAAVPFEDGPGAKDRPCLVLSVRRGSARVVKITTNHRDRPGKLALPPGSVGDTQGRASYLELDEARTVPLADFRRRVGTLDAALWARVRREAR